METMRQRKDRLRPCCGVKDMRGLCYEYTVFNDCDTVTIWFCDGAWRGSMWFMTE